MESFYVEGDDENETAERIREYYAGISALQFDDDVHQNAAEEILVKARREGLSFQDYVKKGKKHVDTAYGNARNAAWRRRRRIQERIGRLPAEILESLPAPAATSIEATLDRAEQLVQRVRLNERERQVFLAKYAYQLKTYAKIAEELGEPNVRALRRVHDRLMGKLRTLQKYEVREILSHE